MGEIELANSSVKTLPFALGAEYPTVSPRGSQLAFSASAASVSIWRKDLQHPESPAVEVAPSSRQQFHASYSPDGSRIVFASRRGGPAGIWVGNNDGSNLVEISNPSYESGSPEWSPDGRKVAFDSRPPDSWEIQVADITERVPRKLITNLNNIFQPHWSRDGQWIYFHSDQAEKEGLYRCPSSGGDADLVSGDIDARVPQESFDGAHLYFNGSVGGREMKQIALSKGGFGAESKVEGFPKVNLLFTVSREGIYFVPADTLKSVSFYDFSTKKVRPIFAVQNDFDEGLSVSPDGRWILYSQAPEVNNDIMLVDHFR
jgi:Tol biopolymer transport system component